MVIKIVKLNSAQGGQPSGSNQQVSTLATDAGSNICKSSWSDGRTKREIYKDRDHDLRVVKEVVYEDRNGDGKFEANEITSISIFGYSNSGNTARSVTYTDKDADGYADFSSDLKTYKKNDCGEYILKGESDCGEMTIEEIQQKISKGYNLDFWIHQLNRRKMENINGEDFQKHYNQTSDRANYMERFGSW